jgi:hypothetical protein
MTITIDKDFLLYRRFIPPVPESHYWENKLLQTAIDIIIAARADSKVGIAFDDVIRIPQPDGKHGPPYLQGSFGELIDEMCWNMHETVTRARRFSVLEALERQRVIDREAAHEDSIE